MIIRAACITCFSRFNISVSPERKHLLDDIVVKDMAECPRLCGGHINMVNNPHIDELAKDYKEPIHINETELYRAHHGGGLPDEIPRSMELIVSLLKAEKVVDVEAEEYEGFFFIHELKLANGSVLHLTSGRRGAQVFKVTRS